MPQIRIASLTDLACALRDLMGYAPRERLVVAAVEAGRIALVAACGINEVAAHSTALQQLAQRNVYVFGVSEDPALALDGVLTFLQAVPVQRYTLHTITGDQLTTHDDDGHPIHAEPMPAWETTAMAATSIAHGRVSADSREALIDSLDAHDPHQRDACADLLTNPATTPLDAADLYAAITANGTTGHVEPANAAAAALALDNLDTYEAAIKWTNRTDADTQFEFWRQVALLATRDRAYNLAALAGWVGGRGVHAGWALDKVTQQSGLTLLVEAMLQNATSPSEWESFRQHIAH